jgi:hypothetical protein
MIGLTELDKVRITCKQCSAVTESAVASFDRRKVQPSNRRDMSCPMCGSVIRQGGDKDHSPPEDGLDLLVTAWEKLQAMLNHEVRFVVPAGGENSFQVG